MTSATLFAARFAPSPAVWVSLAAVGASLLVGALLVALLGVPIA
jgi:hypothetical protein